MVLHGLDNFDSSAQQAASGDYTPSYTAQAGAFYTGSQTGGELLNTGLGLGFNLASPLLAKNLACLKLKVPKIGEQAAKSGGNVGKLTDDILDWVGPNSTMSKPPGGSDLILGLPMERKQIRFDLTNPDGLDPHVNVKTFKPRNLFAGDRKMIQIGTDHVFPKP
jgi:hypothetical protein